MSSSSRSPELMERSTGTRAGPTSTRDTTEDPALAEAEAPGRRATERATGARPARSPRPRRAPPPPRESSPRRSRRRRRRSSPNPSPSTTSRRDRSARRRRRSRPSRTTRGAGRWLESRPR